MGIIIIHLYPFPALKQNKIETTNQMVRRKIHVWEQQNEKHWETQQLFWIAGVDVAMGLEICWPRERHRPVSDVVVAISKCWGYPMTNTKPRPMLAHQFFVQGAPQLCLLFCWFPINNFDIFTINPTNIKLDLNTINIYKLWTQQMLKLMFPNIAIQHPARHRERSPASSNPCPALQSGWRLWPLHWAVCDTSSHSCHFEGACSVHLLITIWLFNIAMENHHF